MSLAFAFLVVSFSILALFVIFFVGLGYLRAYGHGKSPSEDKGFDAEVWRALALQSVVISEPKIEGEPGGWRLVGTVSNHGSLTLSLLTLHCQVVEESGPLLAFIQDLGPQETKPYAIEAPHLRAAQLDDVLIFPAKASLRP